MRRLVLCHYSPAGRGTQRASDRAARIPTDRVSDPTAEGRTSPAPRSCWLPSPVAQPDSAPQHNARAVTFDVAVKINDISTSNAVACAPIVTGISWL